MSSAPAPPSATNPTGTTARVNCLNEAAHCATTSHGTCQGHARVHISTSSPPPSTPKFSKGAPRACLCLPTFCPRLDTGSGVTLGGACVTTRLLQQGVACVCAMGRSTCAHLASCCGDLGLLSAPGPAWQAMCGLPPAYPLRFASVCRLTLVPLWPTSCHKALSAVV